MKRYILFSLLAAAIASCSEPAGITARPDANVSTSGTLGSVKATDGGVAPPPAHETPNDGDTARKKH